MSVEPSMKQPLKIIADSNAFFIPIEFKIDIFEELQRLLNRNFELVVLSTVKHELETLALSKSAKMRKNATFALSIAMKCTYVKIPEKQNEPTDDAILRIAKAWNAPVLTNDKLLKQKLRDISMPVIYVRAKSRLEINGLIS